ncbi:MAG TPA: hypothetical protein VGV57_13195 [Thermoleophilaceae bacterium]|nr:hypothetical protein [Thermoleophilaceae bacterium]
MTVGATLLVAGCGSGELPATDAEAMLRDLDKVEHGVQAGECDATRPTLRRLDRNVADLPDDVDAEVRTTLDGSVDHLGRLLAEQCKQREPDPVVTEPEPITPPAVDSTPEPSPTVTEPPLETEQQQREEPNDGEPVDEEPKGEEPKQKESKEKKPKKDEPKPPKGDGRDPCPPGSSPRC